MCFEVENINIKEDKKTEVIIIIINNNARA